MEIDNTDSKVLRIKTVDLRNKGGESICSNIAQQHMEWSKWVGFVAALCSWGGGGQHSL